MHELTIKPREESTIHVARRFSGSLGKNRNIRNPKPYNLMTLFQATIHEQAAKPPYEVQSKLLVSP